jgi:hypothetical protein
MAVIQSVSSTTAAGFYKAGSVISIQIAFDETVTVTGTPQLTLETGTTDRIAFYESGSGTNTLTFTYTVQAGDTAADLDYISTSALALNGGTIVDPLDAAANLTLPAPGAAGSLGANSNFVIDGVAPTVTSIGSSTANGLYKTGDVISIQVNFSEAVTVTGTPQLTLETGTTGRTINYAGGTGTSQLTFIYTVQAGDTAADLDYISASALALNGGSIGDTVGNAADIALPAPGSANSLGANKDIVIDTRPAVTSVSSISADGVYTIGQSIVLVVNFTEAVFLSTGSIELQLETGTIDRNATFLAGSGSSTLYFSYTVQEGDWTTDLNYLSTSALLLNGDTVQSSSFVEASLTLPAPGSAGSLASAKALLVDGVRPTATIVVADTALAIGETSLVTITFSERVTGLAIADFTVANGILAGLSSSDGGLTWTATLTPTANVTDTSNLITLDATGVADLAGNTGTGTTDSNNYAIDTQRPTATIVVADTALAAGETSLVTITFSEPVTGLTTADFTVANGTLSALSSSDGGITWTATLTPTANVTDTSNLITLDNRGVADLAGNTGTGTTDSNNYAVDPQRPTATIVVADTALAVGETSLVTITFSEAVTGLAVADFTVANGTLSGLSSGDGGITWTATLTPTANVTDATNLITLDNTGVADLAGFTGTGTTDSNNYAVDTQRPTATIVVADTALAAGETSLVTITFSEPVTGLTTADFTVANGALSALSSSNGGLTWTATLTPTANVTDATNLITLNAAGVTDAAGNTGTGTTDSNNYAVDTQRPTATIVMSDTALVAGETSLVTITFSEPVTGFTLANITAPGGVLTGLSSSDGVTWTAQFKPKDNLIDLTNVITVSGSGITDLAGNQMSGSTESTNYEINSGPTEGDDILRLDSADDIVDALGGNDQVFGGGGDDLLMGGSGHDILKGGRGDDTLLGGTGRDWLNGGRGADHLDGGAGPADTASYANSAAGVTVNLKTGVGSGGDAAGDTLVRIENLTGSAHDDTLTGGDGRNVLKGGAGNDMLTGGAGHDILIGGKGNDTFVLTPPTPTAIGFDDDVVFDFRTGEDRLAVSAATFGNGLSAGSLLSGQFVSNSTGLADDLDVRFIFDTTTDKLYFDADGSGATFNPFLLATFRGNIPDLVYTDFIVT